jgi:DNA-binding transcriptional ArsR family regulator
MTAMTAIYQSRDAANAVTEQLKVYAQPQRLMILSHLLDGEHTVSEIDDATAIGQPALSQQLAALRRAGLVETRRVAKQVYYRLANDAVIACVRNIEAMFQSAGDPVDPAPPPPVRQAPSPSPARHQPSATAGAARFAKIL